MTWIVCRCCAGKGRIELTGVYARTLDLLRLQLGPVTGAELSRTAGCTGPAMNNRLAVLERCGLAVSHRDGSRRLFRATPQVEG